LIVALERLVAEDCRGDPVEVLLWTSKSVRRLAASYAGLGFDARFTTTVAHVALARVRAAVRSQEPGGSTQLPDRDRQFRVMTERVRAAIAAGEPGIPIDTKKKPRVGGSANAGREWRGKRRGDKGLDSRHQARIDANARWAVSVLIPTFGLRFASTTPRSQR
jgi:hypothetical protein